MTTLFQGRKRPLGASIPVVTQTFGSADRNDLHGPAFGQFDLAAQKRFTLPNDRYSTEFRIEVFEVFNVFNATNYIGPSSAWAQ